MIVVYHLIAIISSIILDRLIGDPKNIPHPVVGMGKCISFFEKKLNKGNFRRIKGVFLVVFVLLIVCTLSLALVIGSYVIHPFIGVIIETVLIASTIATKGLVEAANEVKKPLIHKDFKKARHMLSHIVGRETTHLNESEIIRATVETVSENTTDGITAPLFYAFFAGAPLALMYRAVNTCDSMVGYKNERYIDFGWAAARLDDLVNYIPSRLTGLVMILVNTPSYGRTKRACWSVVKRDAKIHASPNSGWNEAAIAALLGIQLGGTNVYGGIVEQRATMGDELTNLRICHITKTNQMVIRTVYSFTALLVICGGVFLVLT